MVPQRHLLLCGNGLFGRRIVKKRPHFFDRERNTQKIALQLIAAQFDQHLLLPRRFNAFSDGHHPEFRGDQYHCLHDNTAPGVLPKVSDEASIDLNGIEREAPEVGKRGVPRTEIIQGDFDAKLLQLMKYRYCLLVAVQKNAFGNLECESTWF